LVSALTANTLAQAVLLVLLITGGIAVYGLLLALFGVIGWSDAVGAFRQTAVSDLRD
jgi:putative peptidoglycan lipid II flippase